MTDTITGYSPDVGKEEKTEIVEKVDTTFDVISKIIKIFVPTVFCCLLGTLQEVVNLAFIGYLDDPAMLAGVGMGNVIINMLGLSIIFGMNMALETLVS